MASGDHYRILAAKCHVRARAEGDLAIRHEWEIMAHSYLRLAEQAERNARMHAVHEPPAVKRHDPAAPRSSPPTQQPQSKLEKD